MALKYVGRAPNNDAALVTKAYVDSQHDTLQADEAYIASAVTSYATTNNLKTQAYVDTQDNNRAKKAAVTAADANYLPATDQGIAGGVASLNGSLYVPSAQLPTLVLENAVAYAEASGGNIFLNTEQTVTSSATKTFLAATLTINDPGFAYIVVPMAFVAGYCPAAVDGSRRVSGGSRGKMTVLTQTDALMGGGTTAGNRGNTVYPVLPTAALGTTPSSLLGTTTLSLWLSLHSGTSFVFAPGDFKFFAIVMSAG